MRSITLHKGDNRLSLAKMAENSVDAVATDAPYGYDSLTPRFGKEGAAPAKHGKDGAFKRLSTPFMGKQWDATGIERDPEFWRQVFRVLKPGGYIVAFASPRTYHRMAVAIEDAGFTTHPLIGWVNSQGFPKAHAADKAIDKHLGKTGEIAPHGKPVKRMIPGADQNKVGWEKTNGREYQPGKYIPATEEAGDWEGWAYGGQVRKPALEPIYVGQKPFSEKSGAANILKWGVGAVNVDGCRTDAQRHPANLIHDGSPEVVALFPDSKGQQGAVRGDSGSAARFFECYPFEDQPIFYHPKAGKLDRANSRHPTVKPIALMQYLIRHITPPGGTVLDPFAGSGTTGVAAQREGFDCILMEAEPEYVDFLNSRFGLGNDFDDLLGFNTEDLL